MPRGVFCLLGRTARSGLSGLGWLVDACVWHKLANAVEAPHSQSIQLNHLNAVLRLWVVWRDLGCLGDSASEGEISQHPLADAKIVSWGPYLYYWLADHNLFSSSQYALERSIDLMQTRFKADTSSHIGVFF